MLEEIKKADNVLNLFIELAKIPSPSLKEDNVSSKIIEILTENGINAKKDDYGNVIAYLEANNSTNDGVILSSHMDVVGGSEPVNIRLSKDGKYIETDKTRTLGADDKAGIAVILDNLIYFKQHPEISHPKIEVSFTRDEEFSMTGIQHLDTTNFTSKNALILDGEKLGECNVAGAGMTYLYINVKNGKGGHSGNDINDKSRVNANRILSEILSKLPLGVYKENEFGVITSINLAVMMGGSAGVYLKNNKEDMNFSSPKQAMEQVINSSFKNIIPQDAFSGFSIRSSEPDNEKELLKEIENIVNEAKNKYAGLIDIEMKVEKHLPPFVNDANEEFVNKIIKAGEKNNIFTKPSSFHAAAETHVLQNSKVNKNSEKFKPILLGIANILNMHSPDEQIEYKTLLIGRNWIRDIIKNL